MSLKPIKTNKTVVQIPIQRGAMTRVMKELGWKYEKVSDIPDKRLSKFADALIDKYGIRRALAQVRLLLIWRKNAPNRKDTKKFKKLYQILEEKYKNWGEVKKVAKKRKSKRKSRRKKKRK
ncbi:MAG: hypothetical protein Q6363_007850 [Candidatus Njordarchaeota archaeon]